MSSAGDVNEPSWPATGKDPKSPVPACVMRGAIRAGSYNGKSLPLRPIKKFTGAACDQVLAEIGFKGVAMASLVLISPFLGRFPLTKRHGLVYD